jgi:hypothetical protein
MEIISFYISQNSAPVKGKLLGQPGKSSFSGSVTVLVQLLPCCSVSEEQDAIQVS